MRYIDKYKIKSNDTNRKNSKILVQDDSRHAYFIGKSFQVA